MSVSLHEACYAMCLNLNALLCFVLKSYALLCQYVELAFCSLSPDEKPSSSARSGDQTSGLQMLAARACSTPSVAQRDASCTPAGRALVRRTWEAAEDSVLLLHSAPCVLHAHSFLSSPSLTLSAFSFSLGEPQYGIISQQRHRNLLAAAL